MTVDVAVAVAELVDRDLPFGLVADVDGDVIAGHLHDASPDDLARLDRPQALLEERAEILHLLAFGRAELVVLVTIHLVWGSPFPIFA